MSGSLTLIPLKSVRATSSGDLGFAELPRRRGGCDPNAMRTIFAASRRSGLSLGSSRSAPVITGTHKASLSLFADPHNLTGSTPSRARDLRGRPPHGSTSLCLHRESGPEGYGSTSLRPRRSHLVPTPVYIRDRRVNGSESSGLPLRLRR